MMQHLEALADRLLEEKLVSRLAVRVGMGECILGDCFRCADEHTLFDMASVTKLLAPTMLTLMAAEEGSLAYGDPVSRFFRVPEDKASLTVKNLLTHTVGIGHKPLNKPGYRYETIENDILSIPLDLPVGKNVLYSCPGFILLGRILETVYGKRLDALFRERVAKPLGMNDTSYLPDRTRDIAESNPDRAGYGVVNDYNCRFLGGVAGNAGIFSDLSDMTRFAGVLRNRGVPLLREETFLRAVENHTPGMSEARGLGFLYVDERYPQTGRLFSPGSFGHCGHTGQSVFVDGRTGLYMIILSDATLSTVRRSGGEQYGEVMRMRARLHNAAADDLGL